MEATWGWCWRWNAEEAQKGEGAGAGEAASRERIARATSTSTPTLRLTPLWVCRKPARRRRGVASSCTPTAAMCTTSARCCWPACNSPGLVLTQSLVSWQIVQMHIYNQTYTFWNISLFEGHASLMYALHVCRCEQRQDEAARQKDRDRHRIDAQGQCTMLWTMILRAGQK